MNEKPESIEKLTADLMSDGFSEADARHYAQCFFDDQDVDDDEGQTEPWEVAHGPRGW